MNARAPEPADAGPRRVGDELSAFDTAASRPYGFLPLGETATYALAAVHRLDGVHWIGKGVLGRLRNLGLIEVRDELWRTTELGAQVATAMAEHELRTSRRSLGTGAVRGSGMRYGVNADCTCLDWKGYSNESAAAGGLSSVRHQHARHLTEVLGATP